MSTLTVKVQGVSGIRRALRPLLEPGISRELDAATKKSAQTYAKALRAALRPVSRRMSRAVRVKRAKRDRPAWVVGSRRKVAFFWPFVIGGTKDHGPRRAPFLRFKDAQGKYVRASRVRGVKANPIVDRVARSVERQAAAQADKSFVQGTGL